MYQSFIEYWPAVLYQTFAVVILALVGLRGDLRDFLRAHSPPWITKVIDSRLAFALIALLGLLVGPFYVFHTTRVERDRYRSRAALVDCEVLRDEVFAFYDREEIWKYEYPNEKTAEKYRDDRGPVSRFEKQLKPRLILMLENFLDLGIKTMNPPIEYQAIRTAIQIRK